MTLTADLSVDLGVSPPDHNVKKEYADPADGRKTGFANWNQSKSALRKQEERDRKARIASGTWPGYCAAVQDVERPGTWIAVVLLNRGQHRYVRRESFARFTSSEDAYRAAESWLAREIEKMRRS